MTYFFQAPECLGLATAIAYPVGIVAAALFLGIFIWRTLIVGKDDVAPLHAAKNLILPAGRGTEVSVPRLFCSAFAGQRRSCAHEVLHPLQQFAVPKRI